MPASGESTGARPHIVLLPSAGMGHLVPFGRLAVALSSSHVCDVSMAAAVPTVSAAESRHLDALFAAHPSVRRLDFRLAPFDESQFPGADPFFLRFESMRRSVPLLGPLLAGAAALVTDIVLASVVLPIARERGVPCYILFTASAAMLALCAHFPAYLDANNANSGGVGDVEIPGVYRVPKSSIPQALHDPTHIFTRQFVANGRGLAHAAGVLVNTFDDLEPEAVAALRDGAVVAGFPPVFAVGPLRPVAFPVPADGPAKGGYMAWLDAQPARSVVYVSFGSRKAVSREQLAEIAAGLEASGHRFLWVVKGAVVDKDDAAELGDLIGADGFLDRVKARALVTKAWVEQEAVLRHASVALFLSHCGWNSVTEAARSGVPVLAWPRAGDQRVNAGVVKRAGLGEWVERWSWEGEDAAVSAEEVAEKVKSVMADEAVAKKAAKVRDAAEAAAAEGGSSYRSLAEFVGRCLMMPSLP